MSANPLFFAFPDAVLKYDCANCHERLCCHGGGINLAASGRGAELLRRYPAMQLEVMPQAGNMLYAPLLPSGCRFCENGQCAIHQQDFYPAFCQLYPFTLLALVDGTMIIGPDPRCPCRAVTDGSGVKHSDLSQILANLEPCVIPVTANNCSAQLGKEVLIRDTAADCLQNGDGLATLLAFTHVVDHHSAAELPEVDVTAEMAAFTENTKPILAQWLELIGLGAAPEQPVMELEQLLLANLTVQRLFGRWEDSRTFALAYLALAAYLFRLPPVLQKRTTPLDVCQYFSSLEPLIWHLVHWNRQPVFVGELDDRWSGLTTAASWGEFLKSRQQLLPAATIVEWRLIYEKLHGGLSWK